MKKYYVHVVAFAGLTLGLVAFVANAAEFRAGDEYGLRKGETVSGNLYVAGGRVTVEGDVNGDLMAAGGNLIVSGLVAKDAAVAGGDITVSGAIGEDLRVGGGNIVISGNSGGDLLVAGGSVHVTSGAVVNGDATVAGGEVVMEGRLNGNLRVAGGTVEINGPVAGSVDVRAGQKLVLGPSASIGGDLRYTAPQESERDAAAKIAGKVSYQQSQARGRMGRGILFGLFGIWWIFKLLALLTAALLLFHFWPAKVRNAGARVDTDFGRALLAGFLTAIIGPVAIVALMVSIAGFFIGLAAAFVYALMLLVACILSGIVLGFLIYRHLLKGEPERFAWQHAALGVIVLEVVKAIPLLGWIAYLLLFLAALGVISVWGYRRFWPARKQKATIAEA